MRDMDEMRKGEETESSAWGYTREGEKMCDEGRRFGEVRKGKNSVRGMEEDKREVGGSCFGRWQGDEGCAEMKDGE